MAALPESGTDRLVVVALGADESFVVDHERQLRERARSRPEDLPGPVPDVEERLVARAEQLLGLLLVEADRTSCVGAHLGVGDHALEAPRSRALVRRW